MIVKKDHTPTTPKSFIVYEERQPGLMKGDFDEDERQRERVVVQIYEKAAQLGGTAVFVLVEHTRIDAMGKPAWMPAGSLEKSILERAVISMHRRTNG